MTLSKALTAAVTRAKAPGAAALVGRHDDILFHKAAGHRRLLPDEEPAKRNTLYDMASLTKVLATTTAFLLLMERDALSLDRSVYEFLPLPGLRPYTLRHLLTHTTGLPPFKPWYKDVHSIDEVIKRIAELTPDWTPGSRRRYSDLNFMMLGHIVELLAADRLDAFCHREIFKPMGMKDTQFCPPEPLRDRCAATEKCAWRGRVMQGEVHDEMAYAVGGVSGHAGLFSTAEDVGRYCRGLLSGKLLRESTLADLSRLGQVPTYPWQGLGWKMDPWMDGSEGFLPSRRAIGHTGWTGTSLWIDLDKGLYVALLSNTCHPSREDRDSKTLRDVFHRAVALEYYPDSANVHTGIDRLVWDGGDAVRGKRLAVLTNQSARDQLGRPLLEALALFPEAPVRKIFSPEHGFHGQAEAGADVASENGHTPVISLYGDKRAPDKADLKDIDCLVVDLPDIGSRYYTYMATMKSCLDVCADAGLPVLVLDRPNPLGGVVMEGSVAEQTGKIVCCAPMPARHGKTLGELASWFQRLGGHPEKLLTVLPADGWAREDAFPACGLTWQPPSPNIPTPETALLYAGMCLFEGVNMNEGRGTETPFQRVGAPWLAAADVIAKLPSEALRGCRVEAVEYTPRSIPGKSAKPVCMDQPCQGVHITVTSWKEVRPFTLAAALLRAIHRRHGDALVWLPYFDVLAGGPALRQALCGEAALADVIAAWTAAQQQFAQSAPTLYTTRADWD